MAKLPVNLSKAREAWREVSAVADRAASVLLAGEPALVEGARVVFAAGGTTPSVLNGGTADLAGLSTYPGELLIVFATVEEENGVRVLMDEDHLRGPVVLAVDEGRTATGAVSRVSAGTFRVSFADTSAGWAALFAACAQAAGHDLVALARRYPALRKAAARRVINQTAAQNALIGLLFIIPGADMPAMTLNQVKMLLYLASIHDLDIDADRAVELLAMVALGFGFRGLARRVAVLVPGFGWLYKALVAYLATSAVGSAALRYFENGSPAATSRLVALAGDLRR